MVAISVEDMPCFPTAILSSVCQYFIPRKGEESHLPNDTHTYRVYASSKLCNLGFECTAAASCIHSAQYMQSNLSSNFEACSCSVSIM